MKKNLFRHLTALLAVIMILGVIPAYTATVANNVKIKPVDVRMNFDGMELRPQPDSLFSSIKARLTCHCVLFPMLCKRMLTGTVRSRRLP